MGVTCKFFILKFIKYFKAVAENIWIFDIYIS